MPHTRPTPELTELILIRHAPAQNGGRLAGRRDVAALVPDAGALAAVRDAIGPVDRLVQSPARRCRETAAALFPGRSASEDARLWEQDFGDWEGADPATLPDLGPLSRDDLARHRPPGGESFADLCLRVTPALADLPAGRSAIIAHAGTVRAGLACALGTPGPALAFEVAPLSVTILRGVGADWSVICVNRIFGP